MVLTCKCFVLVFHLLAPFKNGDRPESIRSVKKSLYRGREAECFHMVSMSKENTAKRDLL